MRFDIEQIPGDPAILPKNGLVTYLPAPWLALINFDRDTSGVVSIIALGDSGTPERAKTGEVMGRVAQ